MVDDSAPHCFLPSEAIARFRQHADILFTEGGLLRMTEPVSQCLSVSGEMLTSLPADRLRKEPGT